MLEGLYAGSLEDAAERELVLPSSALEKRIGNLPHPVDALKTFAPRENIHVLAEVKRASPSRGDLAQIESAANLAVLYEQGGASGISVLTEQRKFRGSLGDLEQVRAAVEVPLLRKDFIATEYQLLEARAFGADIALLIVAGLDQNTLKRLMKFTSELGLTPFVETHNQEELSRALDLGAKFVGVNARDLSTFETDRNLFSELVGMFPADVIKVAESAVRNVGDVRHYRDAGADVVLIGEALVTTEPLATLASFLEV